MSVSDPLSTGSPIAPLNAPPRFFYGWVMLGIAILAQAASSPGQTYGISIFNEPMRETLHLSHSQLATAYMLGTLCASFPIAWFGALMDRHGLRRMLLLGVTAFALACGLTSCVTGWLSLFGAFFLLRLLGPGALSLLSGNILSHWFHRRLGLVEGLRQLGMAVAMGFIPALNLWLVKVLGWRGAYAALGACVWCLMMPFALFLFRNRPEDVGQHLDGDSPSSHVDSTDAQHLESSANLTLSQTLHSWSFWVVTAGIAWFGLVQTGIFFCMVPLFEDRLLTAQDAAHLMAVFSVSLAVTTFLGGTLSDHLSPRVLLSIGMAGFGLALTSLYWMHSSRMAMVTGALLGMSQGLYFGASQPLWVRYFGRLHLGKIRGINTTIIVASSSTGPLIAGLVRDATGSFDSALLVFLAVPWPLALLCCSLRSPRLNNSSYKAAT